MLASALYSTNVTLDGCFDHHAPEMTLEAPEETLPALVQLGGSPRVGPSGAVNTFNRRCRFGSYESP